MDRYLHLPVASLPGLDDVVDLFERGEARGYDAAYLPETWGRDAVTTLALAAERTDEIGIGSSILNTYSRSPALVGQTAATLQEASDGRFRLGIGPSGPAVVEGWHGADFGNPLRRTREYVEILRQVLSGEEVRYDGDYFRLGGFRLRCDPPEPTPPVEVAGMGPKAVELAGRFGDGWHALMFTPDGLRDRLADLDRGAGYGDRDRDALRVTLSIPCCVLPDGDRARELTRRHVAFYLGGMGTFYRDALVRQGYEDRAHAIHDAWDRGDRAEAVSLVADDLLSELAVCGTPEEARADLDRFSDIEGVDALAVSFPRAAELPEIHRTLAALAPE